MNARRSSIVTGFALAVLLPVLVVAETYDASTGYVTLKASDGKVSGNQTYSLTPGYQYHRWSDDQPLHTGTNYYVGAGLTAQADSSADAVIEPTLVAAGRIDPRGAWSRVYTFRDLRMLPGSSLNHNQINLKKGTITVLSEDPANPAKLNYDRNQDVGTFRLGAKVIGSASSQLAVTWTYTGYHGSTLDLNADTDWSEFLGTLTVRDDMGITLEKNVPLETPAAVRMGRNCHLNMSSAGCPCGVGELVFVENAGITNLSSALSVAGLFDTGTNARWRCESAVTAGHLVLNRGLSFVCNATAMPLLTVTKKLEIGDDVAFTYQRDPYFNPTVGKEPLKMLAMKIAPEAVQAGLPDFSKIKLTLGYFYQTWAVGQPPIHCYFTVEDDPDVSGGKCVYATHDPIVAFTGPNEWQNVYSALDGDADQVGIWSDHLFPHAGAAYSLGDRTNIVFAAADADHPNRTTTFPGDMLICKDLTTLYVTAPSAYVENLVFFGRSTIYPRERDNIHWGGNLQLCKYSDPNPATLQVIGWATFYLDSKLSGAGALNCQSYYPTKNGGATVYLTADNTDWSGALLSSWYKQNDSTPDTDVNLHTRVVVGDGKSLGGDSGAFRYDAIQLANYTEVRFTNTTAMAVANRGIVVTDNGELRVDAAQTATVASPVTLNGVLRKTGAGSLALAGGVRYGLNSDLADETAPTEGRNVIRVEGGDLKIAQAEGVAFSLAAGVRLLVDAESGPLSDTTAATPFVSDDGLVRIAPDAATTAKPERGLVLPLLRVSSAAADAIDAAKMLQVKSVWKGVKCTSLVRTDAEGVATYTGTFEPVGVLLIVR